VKDRIKFVDELVELLKNGMAKGYAECKCVITDLPENIKQRKLIEL